MKTKTIKITTLIILVLLLTSSVYAQLQVIYLSSNYNLLVYCLEGTDPQTIQYDGYIQVICDPTPQATYLPTILK